jgi:hypothetical protein
MPTQTNLVIKTPANILKLVTKKEIHIYAKNRTIASKFKKIVKKHSTIWTDQGIINLLLKQQLKVPLVDS